MTVQQFCYESDLGVSSASIKLTVCRWEGIPLIPNVQLTYFRLYLSGWYLGMINRDKVWWF